MNIIEALDTLLERHEVVMKELAVHEANGKVLLLSFQLTRLRTGAEQKALLQKSYTETLAALEELDKGPFGIIYHARQLLPHATVTMQEVSKELQRFEYAFSKSEEVDEMDYSEFLTAEMSEITKDSIAYQALEAYRAYAVNEYFLDRVSETLDYLDLHKEQKLSAEQLQTGASAVEMTETIRTMIQQAVQPLYEKERPQFDKAYMNMDEAAAYLKIAKQTLYRHTGERTIPFIKRGKNNLFKQEELDKWLEKGKKHTREQLREEIAHPKSRK